MLESIHFLLLAFGPRSKVQSPTFPARSLSMVLWREHLPLTWLRGKTSPPQQSKTMHRTLRTTAVKEGLVPKQQKLLLCMWWKNLKWKLALAVMLSPWRWGDWGESGPLCLQPCAQRCRISMPTRCAFAHGHQGTSWPDQQASFPCAASGEELRQKDHSWPTYGCSYSWSKWRRRECWLDNTGAGELWQGLPGSYPARTIMCSESF